MKLIRSFLLAFATLIVGVANAFYGFSGNPNDQSTWQDSFIYPENAYQVKMRQPDGVERIFQRNPSDPHALICPSPWIGEIRGKETLVMTDPEFKEGQTGFMFENGTLRRMILDGNEIAVQSARKVPRHVAELWPMITDEMVRDATARFGKHWAGRLTLWYRNPNCAAMFIVEVFLLALGALALRRKWIVWPLAIPLMAVCFLGLIKTGSRGGMVGLICGAGCFLVFRMKALLTWKRILLILVAFGTVALGVHFTGTTERFTSGLIHEGYSDVSRIPIWIEAPRMMVASFPGWGLGHAGNAYMNWFQPFDRFHCIAGLISTHLTWLVEFGWPMRCLYVFLWTAGLLCLASDAFRGRSVLPVAVWSAFFIGLIFNSVGVEWSLWVLPCLMLAISTATRPWERWREYVLPGGMGIVLSALVIGAFLFIGTRDDGRVRICGGRCGRVIANGDTSAIWVVDDGFTLDGGYYGVLGKEVRLWYRDHADVEPIGFVKRLGDLPGDVRRLVLAGKSAVEFLSDWKVNRARYASIPEIVFLSPPFGVGEIPAALLEAHKVTAYVGAYAANMSGDSGKLPSWAKSVPGCAVYINGWLRRITR